MVSGADTQCPKCGSSNCAHWPTQTQVWGPQALVIQHACSDCHYTWIKCVSNPAVEQDDRSEWP